jgi:hypothetical protein
MTGAAKPDDFETVRKYLPRSGGKPWAESNDALDRIEAELESLRQSPSSLAPAGGDKLKPAGSVTVRTKLIELDASHDDALLRIALDGDCHAIGRAVAPFMYDDVELTITRLPAPPEGT